MKRSLYGKAFVLMMIIFFYTMSFDFETMKLKEGDDQFSVVFCLSLIEQS